MDGHSLPLHLHNAAREDADRRAREAERKREYEAVAAAGRVKRSVLAAAPYKRPSQPADPAIFAPFERLRERAESEITHSSDRRPSWAPPLVLGDELAENCIALGYLGVEDKPIERRAGGRVWGPP